MATQPAHGVPAKRGSSLAETEPSAAAGSVVETGQQALVRLQSFGVIYIAIGLFILLSVFSVKGAEQLLDLHFNEVVTEALQPQGFDEPIALQIQRRLNEQVRDSVWTQLGGVRVTPIVIGRDGVTLIYAGSSAGIAPPSRPGFIGVLREAERLLPASAQVTVSVPYNSLLANGILIGYAVVLLQGLFLYNRALARREARVLEAALAARDRAAERAGHIEGELEAVRERLLAVEPSERDHAREIGALQREREGLQSQLAGLAEREEELRGKAEQSLELDQERRALEDLLEEAGGELSSKDEEIHRLEQRLRKANRGGRSGSSRAKDGELLSRRLRTLYKTIEIDDRAVSDMVALGDEALKLKAEESIKRLADAADNVAVRRKVGGLPSHLSIYELSFAGKGRIYYAKGKTRRFRILSVGGKASQKVDLEYLSRLGRHEL